ncbi:hypothetical protein BDZ97DRAFT_354666 [Flammula alnicola]|nr:hypothetical protein BDZ97DRAFT_354666 [Flammula alnicola]
MKLSNALSFPSGVWFGLTVALMPTLRAIMASPTLLFKPRALSRVYMANLWPIYADGMDENAKDTKSALITPHAYGVVLDIGAGHGHTVRYLDADRVSRYIALEPNALMHPQIRAQANAAGFHEADGTLVILACGAEDTKSIISALALALPTSESSTLPSVDTLVSALALCTVPEPQRTISNLVRDVLKSGGQFLMYEHVLSPREDVAWWQRFWAPLWSLGFDGCRIDRCTDVWVKELKVDGEGGQKQSAWRESRTWVVEGQEEENFFFWVVGRFDKQ